ncbi:exported hypothetical protein [Syntrophobacter sp. SbD1]|nr:exported hypothetical protein [Syntrophobacter sp. SbD1]
MQNRSRFLATSLIVILSIGVFAIAGSLQAADQGMMEGQKAMMEGAKKMMDGNKIIMDTVAKKGIKDPELTAAGKMMTEGYNMITKGESMMTGSTMAEGQTMVKKGAKMMLDAQKMTSAAVTKLGPEVVRECTIALDSCTYAEKQIKEGALEWFFGF